MNIRFRDVLRPEAILLDPQVPDRPALLALLGARLRLDERLRSPEIFLKMVRDREGEGETVIGHGLWMPHARSEEVSELVMAMACLKTPLGPEGIRCVVLVGIPPHLAPDYLRLVGCLVRAWKDEVSRSSLLGAAGVFETLALLDKWSA